MVLTKGNVFDLGNVFILSVISLSYCDRCPDSWDPFQRSCYKVFAQTVNWTDALTNCESEGASLLAISSSEERNFVRDLRYQKYGYCVNTWIGFNDRENQGVWKWTTNSATQYTDWLPGQPNDVSEHCAVIICSGIDKNWQDYPCSHYFNFYVCEIEQHSSFARKVSGKAGQAACLVPYALADFTLDSKATRSLAHCFQFCISIGQCKAFQIQQMPNKVMCNALSDEGAPTQYEHQPLNCNLFVIKR
ncbi:C-type lectin lectoxin-Lio2-like isoform X1 [Anneissia japonica]|uniref:C-type lectin lectoxin-Lio2-like isoform X1 n=1 Tax=Anneissia japonica TaxID=1529436 RepID=UPI0014256A29|nr:C-type lectin lectoxin-Lio2-like isoform X1 [Anneissia japonica]